MAESEFTRVTVSVSAARAPAASVAAIRAHAATYGLGDVLAAAHELVQTTSTPKRRRLGRRQPPAQESLALVTAEMLIWAVSDGREPAVVMAFELKRVEIADYATGPLAKLVSDSGIEVTGVQVDATTPVAAFLGLGPGRDSDRFRAALAQATRDAGGSERL